MRSETRTREKGRGKHTYGPEQKVWWVEGEIGTEGRRKKAAARGGSRGAEKPGEKKANKGRGQAMLRGDDKLAMEKIRTRGWSNGNGTRGKDNDSWYSSRGETEEKGNWETGRDSTKKNQGWAAGGNRQKVS